ncbi:MAG: alkaline phosphatase [Bacteroidales bacterium]|nr:alkaline phosphatase [Bacteroidales bacterium]
MKRFFSTFILLIITVLVFAQGQPKNVILLIGDGMGPEQVRSLKYLNGGVPGVMTQFPYHGWSMTYSLSDTITDSAAGGSALSTGKKTINGYVACNEDGTPNQTLLEWAHQHGKATGIVVTSHITDATPADFYAHVTSRKMMDEIARQLAFSDVDFAVGGYLNYFLPDKRDDKLALVDTMKKRGYTVCYNTTELTAAAQLPVVALMSEKKPDRASDRGEWLAPAVTKALQLLENDEDGFFLMVEGSQIDWACHVNNFGHMSEEILDFDNAVLIAYQYAQTHPNTLVIVTADHETGGLKINDKIDRLSPKTAQKKLKKYVTWKKLYHTNTDVPVYAFGPGAELFQGRMENTDIPQKIWSIWK